MFDEVQRVFRGFVKYVKERKESVRIGLRVVFLCQTMWRFDKEVKVRMKMRKRIGGRMVRSVLSVTFLQCLNEKN